jgi:hypothetical protein
MPIPAVEAGLTDASKLVDLTSLPVIRQKVSPVDQGLMDIKQANAYRETGNLLVPSSPFVPQQAPQSGPLPPIPPPAQQTTPPVTQPAVPVTTGPEIRPTDPPRYQERLNQLYGNMKSAEERAASLENRVQELLTRLDARDNQPPAVPFTNQFGSYPPPPQQQQPNFEPSQAQPQPNAGPFISRNELNAILAAERQVSAIRQSHVVSRLEAERVFPDVFQNPELKSIADRIWDQDRALQADPRGPEKAALLARGIYYTPGTPQPAAAPASAQVRKEAIGMVGPSVAQGNEQSPNDQAARFQAAMNIAIRTQRTEDFARARRIQQGQE